MAEITPFKWGWFYDVPRCISLRYRGERFVLQSDSMTTLTNTPATASHFRLEILYMQETPA
jgi:hypothetical protein